MGRMDRVMDRLDALDERVPGSHPDRRNRVGIPRALVTTAVAFIAIAFTNRYGGRWALVVSAGCVLLAWLVRRIRHRSWRS